MFAAERAELSLRLANFRLTPPKRLCTAWIDGCAVAGASPVFGDAVEAVSDDTAGGGGVGGGIEERRFSIEAGPSKSTGTGVYAVKADGGDSAQIAEKITQNAILAYESVLGW